MPNLPRPEDAELIRLDDGKDVWVRLHEPPGYHMIADERQFLGAGYEWDQVETIRGDAMGSAEAEFHRRLNIWRIVGEVVVQPPEPEPEPEQEIRRPDSGRVIMDPEEAWDQGGISPVLSRLDNDRELMVCRALSPISGGGISLSMAEAWRDLNDPNDRFDRRYLVQSPGTRMVGTAAAVPYPGDPTRLIGIHHERRPGWGSALWLVERSDDSQWERMHDEPLIALRDPSEKGAVGVHDTHSLAWRELEGGHLIVLWRPRFVPVRPVQRVIGRMLVDPRRNALIERTNTVLEPDGEDPPATEFYLLTPWWDRLPGDDRRYLYAVLHKYYDSRRKQRDGVKPWEDLRERVTTELVRSPDAGRTWERRLTGDFFLPASLEIGMQWCIAPRKHPTDPDARVVTWAETEARHDQVGLLGRDFTQILKRTVWRP